MKNVNVKAEALKGSRSAATRENQNTVKAYILEGGYGFSSIMKDAGEEITQWFNDKAREYDCKHFNCYYNIAIDVEDYQDLHIYFNFNLKNYNKSNEEDIDIDYYCVELDYNEVLKDGCIDLQRFVSLNVDDLAFFKGISDDMSELIDMIENRD